MRRDAEFFEGAELSMLYMARRLRDALRLEAVLTNSGVNYCVETGEYTAGLLMKRELTGAFFYVTDADLEPARALLRQNRFKPYEPPANQK